MATVFGADLPFGRRQTKTTQDGGQIPCVASSVLAHPSQIFPSTRAVPANSRFVLAGHCCIGSGGFGVDHGLQRAQQNEEPFRQGVGLVLHPYIWEAGLIECIVPVAMKELCCELCNLARLQSRGTFLGELLAAWER